MGTAIVERGLREQWDVSFTVMARNETRMAQFKKLYPHVRCEIGDVRDLSWLATIMPGHDVCIHAAAIKQVPTAEANVRETVLTNVVGSQNVAMACVEAGVGRVIGISTDKACASRTTYGATKFLMEGLFREANNWSPTTDFILVRYGNVARSNASVIPLFERQMAEDKPFTVTCREMTRFWLSMPQAIDLVLTAMKWDETGVVLVPKPRSMSMENLCKALDPKREIVEIGIRPGEKIHEELINSSEALHTEDHRMCYVIYPPQIEVNSELGLPSGFEFTSKNALPLSDVALYQLLDDYNPYGGKIWSSTSLPKA